MKQSLTAALVLGGLAASLATPLAAQTAPAATPAPEAPAATAPEAGSPEAKPDSALERQRNSAAKLAGLVVFVANSCPEAQPDYGRFKQVIAGMGINIDDLSKGELMARSASYTQAYLKDKEASCKRAFEHFGEKGTTLPGLILHKAPENAPEKAP